MGSFMASSTLQPSEKLNEATKPIPGPKEPFKALAEAKASEPKWEAPSAAESEEEESGDEMEAKEEGSDEGEEEESAEEEEESQEEESSAD